MAPGRLRPDRARHHHVPRPTRRRAGARARAPPGLRRELDPSALTSPIRLHFQGPRVTGIYSDAVAPLFDALGTKAVTRASHVEYDNTLGGWTSRSPMARASRPKGVPEPYVFATRQAALAAEIGAVEQRLRGIVE